MTQKFIHKVSPELTDNAQYKSIGDIPSVDLTQGSTIRLYPGTYDAVSASWDNIAVEGVGDPADVILNGLVLSNTAANTVTLQNMTVYGSNSMAASGKGAIEVGSPADAGGSVTLKLKNVILANADFGVIAHGNTMSVQADFVDATGVDRAYSSNANVTTNFSILNTSSNAYFTAGGAVNNGATGPVSTVTLSHSGGANVGTTTETVRAAIS